MTRARVLTTICLFLHWQASYGQENGVATSCQQTVQNNAGFSQTVEPGNRNIQMHQNAVQASNSQQSYNLQQLANIPMQTFNVQQPVNFQQETNSPTLNFQPVNQAIGLQQIPQSISIQDVQQHVVQHSSNPVNLQQTPVVHQINAQQPLNFNAAPQSINLQQMQPIQAINLQQQSFPTLQQQQVPTANLQHPSSQQCLNIQNSGIKQSGNLQQQTAVHNANIQQVTPQQVNLQHTSQPYINLQQQPVITYQQPVTINEPIVTQLNLQNSALQQPYNVQQMQLRQIDSQQKQVPCHNIGYQVISYQRPFQQADVTTAVPNSIQLSKVSSSSYPTVIAAIPVTDSKKVLQKVDHMYFVSPQNYINSAPYTPVLVTENSQQISSNMMPITSTPNSSPTSIGNSVINNHNQYPGVLDNRSSSSKTSDLLSIIQGQFPIASMLDEPRTYIQSALLSSILSSIQNPSSSHQYITTDYPGQTVLSQQCNTHNSKFSLKSLLPLLLNLLQEKYTNNGCQCHCCNCECSRNNNIEYETDKPDESQEITEEATEEPSIDNEDYLEVNDTRNNPHHRKKSKFENMIPDDSAEIDEKQDSSRENEDDDTDTVDGDEDDFFGDSKL